MRLLFIEDFLLAAISLLPANLGEVVLFTTAPAFLPESMAFCRLIADCVLVHYMRSRVWRHPRIPAFDGVSWRVYGLDRPRGS